MYTSQTCCLRGMPRRRRPAGRLRTARQTLLEIPDTWSLAAEITPAHARLASSAPDPSLLHPNDQGPQGWQLVVARVGSLLSRR